MLYYTLCIDTDIRALYYSALYYILLYYVTLYCLALSCTVLFILSYLALFHITFGLYWNIPYFFARYHVRIVTLQHITLQYPM